MSFDDVNFNEVINSQKNNATTIAGAEKSRLNVVLTKWLENEK